MTDFPNIAEFQGKTEEEVIAEVSEPIKTGEGLLPYRKYLYALKYLLRGLDSLGQYREAVVRSIDDDMSKKQEAIDNIKGVIRVAMINDPTIDKTKTGGSTLKLPDIATASVSKIKDKVRIEDPKAVLEALGKDFEKVVVSLDIPKAKKHILETGEEIKGTEKYKERTLSIRF